MNNLMQSQQVRLQVMEDVAWWMSVQAASCDHLHIDEVVDPEGRTISFCLDCGSVV